MTGDLGAARQSSLDARQASALVDAFVRVRAHTEALAAPLSAEDQLLQSMPDASPTKWHRAHTTWFFETFFLVPRGVAPVNAEYNYLFNSYYEALGTRHARARRGMISRPSGDEVRAYRKAIDLRMIDLLGAASEDERAKIAPLLALGLAHEEQHQELILTDILHAFFENPLMPAYSATFPNAEHAPAGAMRFTEIEGGLVEIGAADDGTFCFDNELPRHKAFVNSFSIADRPV
ncbi:MAG: DinB family protein, partial [Polyangiaceae bacterium]